MVSLKLDEIHIQPKIYYNSKKLGGYADNKLNEPATQVQAFMISSLMSKYKDVVKLIPVKSNTVEFLYNAIMEVLTDLQEIGYKICCITGDNSKVNRGCFLKLLSESKDKNYFILPGKDIRTYIMFDAPHMIKCVRNNWLNVKNSSKTLEMPNFYDQTKKDNASFKLLRDIYNSQIGMIVKTGYTYNYETMYPKCIERQKVNLALNVLMKSSHQQY